MKQQMYSSKFSPRIDKIIFGGEIENSIGKPKELQIALKEPKLQNMQLLLPSTTVKYSKYTCSKVINDITYELLLNFLCNSYNFQRAL